MIWLGSRITVRDGGGLLWWEPPGAASSSWSAPLVKGPISCTQDDGLVELVWSSNSVVMHSQPPPVRGLEVAFVVDDISPEMELFSEIFCQMPADAGHSSTGKRNQRDATGSPSEVMRDVEYESAHSAAVTKREPSSTGKRRRAAQVKNLSERRRRDMINEKMRALQELIPHCNKDIQRTNVLLPDGQIWHKMNQEKIRGPEKACTEQRGCPEKSPQKEGLHPAARDEPDKAGPARARASTCQTAGPEEKHRITARPLPPPPPVPCSRRRSLHSPLPLRCPLSTPAHLFFWTITGSGELATWES